MSLQTGKPEGSREPYGPQQVVRAESGFAYGAVNADIHVFGDGLPLYLLENWRPAPETDASWLQEQPSRMLNSRFAVVGFTGRADELSQLRTWRESGPRLAARWLHGPGGQGKSRLAAQFAAESAAEGWKVVTATHGPGSVIPEPGSQDMRLDGFAGVLVIVDYADRWPPTHLTWLLSNAMLHQSAVPARVLLLARTVDPWPALRAGLINQQAGISTQFLEPLPSDESGRRAEMFEAARDSFATRYGVSTPAGIAPPVRWPAATSASPWPCTWPRSSPWTPMSTVANHRATWPASPSTSLTANTRTGAVSTAMEPTNSTPPSGPTSPHPVS